MVDVYSNFIESWRKETYTSDVMTWKNMSQIDMEPDCKFQVGDHCVREFACNRDCLAQASPVMEAMLFGNFVEQKASVIRVPDVAPDAFAAMLRYVYEGGVLVDDFDLACELLYTSKKYLLSDTLIDQCRACLWSKIYPTNVWRTLRFASNNDEEKLFDAAWQIMQMYTSEVLLLSDFAEIDEDMLVALLSEDCLSCTELELFDACVRWAQEDPRPLQPLLSHLRLLAMPHEDFVRGPASSEMLSPQQKIELLLYKLDSDKEISISKELCNIQEPRNTHNYESFYVFGTCHLIDQEYNNTSNNNNTYSIFSSFLFKNHANNNTLVLPTQIQNNLEFETYDEDFSVLLFSKCSHKLLSNTRVTAKVNYNSTIEFPYKLSNCISKDVDEIFCQVIFHKTGHYPLYIPSAQENITREIFSFNGTNNTYSYDVFEKKFTLMQYLVHNLFHISTYFFSWSTLSQNDS